MTLNMVDNDNSWAELYHWDAAIKQSTHSQEQAEVCLHDK